MLSIHLSTVFYHINYCHPSVHTTFRLTYETSKSTARYMLKVIVRDTTSLKTTLSKTILLSNELRRSNLNAVNQLLPKVSWKELLKSVSSLVTFRRNKFPETILLIDETHDTCSISNIFKNFFSNLAESLLIKLLMPTNKYNLKSVIQYYSSFAITANFCLVSTTEK